MTRPPNVDAVLRDYFGEDGVAAPDYLLDDIAEGISRQPQRSSWLLRRAGLVTPLKVAAALAAAVVVAVVGFSLLPGNNGIGGPGPTPSPSPTAPPLPDGLLEAGRYRFDPFSDLPLVSIVADVPAGWQGLAPVALQGPQGYAAPEGISMGFLRPEALFGDPCHWDMDGTGALEQPGDVDVGPTAIDLVDALRTNVSYTSSAPSPITFGEYTGYRMEIEFPAELATAECDRDDDGNEWFLVFSGAADDTLHAPGIRDRWTVVIVEVDGTRVAVIVPYFEGTPTADLEAAQSILESLDFNP